MEQKYKDLYNEVMKAVEGDDYDAYESFKFTDAYVFFENCPLNKDDIHKIYNRLADDCDKLLILVMFLHNDCDDELFSKVNITIDDFEEFILNYSPNEKQMKKIYDKICKYNDNFTLSNTLISKYELSYLL